MKKVNKRIILILIILISIIAIILLFNKFNIIENIQTRIARNKALQQEDGISYILYDNQSEKLKIMVIITRQNGIERVEHLDSDENITIYGDNRTVLAMDLNAEVNKEYRFNVVSNGEEKIESITIPENYLDNYFKYIVDESNNLSIEYITDQPDVTITNEYKIGKDSTNWKEYTENIELAPTHMQNIGDTTTIINTKQTDSIGDIISDEETIPIPTTGDFDIFGNCLVRGKTLDEYGFSYKQTGCQILNLSTYNLRAGRSKYDGNYDCTFTLDFSTANLDLLKAKQLYIDYYLYARTAYMWPNWYYPNVGFQATLYYTDETSSEQTVAAARYSTETAKEMIFEIDTLKQIDRLEIRIWGYDDYETSSYGYVNNIILKDVQL